jgi:hypothetical protein
VGYKGYRPRVWGNARKDVPRKGYGKHILEQRAKQKETIGRHTETKLTKDFIVQPNEVKFSDTVKPLHQTQTVKKIIKDESTLLLVSFRRRKFVWYKNTESRA